MGNKKHWHPEEESEGPAPVAPAKVEQANFVATIAISPSLQAQYNFTPDTLQPLIEEVLRKRVNLAPTINVSVKAAD